MLKVSFEVLGEPWNVAADSVGEMGVEQGGEFALAAIKLATVQWSPLAIRAQAGIRDLHVHVEVRLLASIREVQIGSGHGLPDMALVALRSQAIAEVPLLFGVLKSTSRGLHHGALKDDLLLTRQGRVNKGERLIHVKAGGESG
ncbi:hypothetical protein D9M68_473130 [compost metagenome]